MAWSSLVSDWAQHRVETFFYHVGVKVYHRPLSFLLAGIILTLLGSIGFINFFYENDVIELWIPQQSDIYDNYERTKKLFGEYDIDIQVLVSHRSGQNLLTPQNLDLVYNIFNRTIYDVTLKHTYKGQKSWDFQDLCLRNYPSYPTCTTEETGFFSLFGFNPLAWQSQESIQNVINFVGDDLGFFVGGVIVNETTGEVAGGSYILLTLTLEGSFDEEFTEIRELYITEWNSYWQKNFDDYHDDGIDIDFYNSVSLKNEMDRVVFDDVPLLSAAFTIMTLYLTLSLGRKNNWVETRFLLALCALCSVLCALLIGFGFGLAVGFEFNPIILIVPYILIGVGVDGDLIVIETYNTALAAIRRKEDKSNIDMGHEFGMALKHAGFSITLTSLSSVVAFTIGSTIDIPGISAFCAFSSASFTANYVAQFLVFVPFLILDERRVAQGRNCCLFCCIKHDIPSENGELEMIVSQPQSPRNEQASGAAGAASTSADGAAAGQTEDAVNMNFGSDANERCWDHLSISYVLSHYLAEYLSIRWVRLVIIFIFVSWCAGSAVSLQWISTDSELTTLVPDGSYILDFLETIEDGFGQVVFGRMHYVVEQGDFSDESTRNAVLNMFEAIENRSVLDSEYGQCVGEIEQWIDDFFVWSDVNFNVSVDEIDSDGVVGSSESVQFYDLLSEFTNDTEQGFRAWQELILYNYEDSVVSNVKATKFTSLFEFIYDIKDRWLVFDDVTDVIDENLAVCKENSPKCKGYIFSSELELSYLSFVIVELIVSNLAFSIIGVLLMLLFLLDLRMALMVTTCIIMIDIDLLGWMNLNDMPLDMISYGQLVMAVGLTVDYVVHMAHAIADTKPDEKLEEPMRFRQQLSEAFVGIGTGVFKGAFTTFLGVLLLAFAGSQAFRSFFTMFVGIILVSLFHGFFFIPAVLGEFKCIYAECACAKNPQSEENADDNGQKQNEYAE